MKHNQVFQIRNEVRKHRPLPYIFAAGALILVVVFFTVVGSAQGGADRQAVGDPRESGLPLGGGPEKGASSTAAAEEPRPFEDQAWFADPDGLLVVVDRDAALSRRYAPADLVTLERQGVPAQPASCQARRVILDDLRSLFAAGREAGFNFFVFSGYRSYDRQADLYQYWVETIGAAEADRSSARAGHSEHQLGTALDISVQGLTGDVFEEFGRTPAAGWLAAQAWRHGFVLSYPDGREAVSGYMYEPWHFRYVGREAAALIHAEKAVPSVRIREWDRLRRERGKR